MSTLQDSEPDTAMEELAALDFTPWSHEPYGWQPPTNEEWAALANPHLVSVRLAWLTLHKSKEELVTMAEQLGDAALTDLVTQIGRFSDWFEGLHKVLASAERRIICAYAALAAADPEGG